MDCAGSTLIFSRLPLAEALLGLSRIGFSTVEVGAVEGWAHLSPVRAARDQDAVLTELREGLAGAWISAIAINAGLRGTETEQREQALALCRIARAVGAGTLTIPAAAGPGIPPGEADRLRSLVGIAQGYGVKLAVECHMGTLAEDPATAADLCHAVPGLGLTLDPSHFWAGRAQGKGWEVVLPYVRHVHLRDAGFGGWQEIQVAPGKGAVDFVGVRDALRSAGQHPTFAVEYIDTIPVGNGGSAEEAALAMRSLVAEL